MARKIGVELVGNSENLERSFKRAEKSARGFDAAMGRTSRGVIAGSGAFRGLGRSVAFASASFLGGVGFAAILKKTADAGTEAAATHRQLATTFKALHTQLGPYKRRIDETSDSLSNLSGRTRDELEQSFTLAFRSTRNVTQSLRIESIAADVAAGRHIKLAQATLAVTKGVTQNATALKRLGVAIPDNVKGFALLGYLAKRFAGQAAAAATPQQKLAAAMHNLEESAGLVLQPTIKKLSDTVAEWASNSKNQERVQRDVKQGLDLVKGAADDVQKAFHAADEATGSFKNTLKAVLALGAAYKLRQIAISVGMIEAATAGGAVAGGIAGTARSFRRGGPTQLGSQVVMRDLGMETAPLAFGLSGGSTRRMLDAEKASGGLLRNLRGIGKLGAAGIGVTMIFRGQGDKGVQGLVERVFGAGLFGRVVGGSRGGVIGITIAAGMEFFRVGNPNAGEPGRVPRGSRGNYGGNVSGTSGKAGQLSVYQDGTTGKYFILWPNGKSQGPYGSAQAAWNATGFGSRGNVGGAAVPIVTDATSGGYRGVGGKLGTPGGPPLGGGAGNQKMWSKLIVPYELRLEAARAGVTATLRDDVKAAKDERAWLMRLIALGRLRGQALIDAYTALAQVDQTIAQAQQAAAKQAAVAAKQRLANAKQVFADAKQNLQGAFASAFSGAQSVIGGLFQGPVIAPTTDDIKRRLGVRFANTSTGSLTADLNAQVHNATGFFNDLSRLKHRGAPQALINELQQAGLADAPEAHALAGASPAALKAFLKAFRARDQLAARVAIKSPQVRIAANAVTVAANKLDAAGGHATNVYVSIDGHAVAAAVTVRQQRAKRRTHTPRTGRHAGTR